jgi:circadian clock protein KaiC
MSRTKSGIDELDNMLGGGFLAGDAVMLAGSAGAGKTTLALQYIVNGVTKFGENGIYLTFEQLPDQIYRDAMSFGWDLRGLEQQNKLRVLLTSPDVILGENGLKELLTETLNEIHPKRIVIDSLSHLGLYASDKEIRLEAYRLIMYLKAKGLSSMLLWETPEMLGQLSKITDVGLSFLVDCIVFLRPVEINSSLRTALAVVKLRGAKHDKGLREFEITSEGIKIVSRFTGYEGILAGVTRKVTDTVQEKLEAEFKRFIGPMGGNAFGQVKRAGLSEEAIFRYIDDLAKKRVLKEDDAKTFKRSVAEILDQSGA